MRRGVHNSRGGGIMYSDPGSKREDKDKKKHTTTVGSGSGLPTPELETKKLPAEPPRENPNLPETITPPSQRAGKAPERPGISDITLTDDMKSIGAILDAIKQNVTKLENTLDGVSKQAAALTALHAPMKLQAEYQTVQQELQQQMQRQKEAIKQKREELQSLLTRQLDEKIKQRIDAEVHEIVKQKVTNRIQEELAKLIPEQLKRQSLEHDERTLRVRSNLINNEARRRNASAGRTGHPLHRLVMSRPAAISRSSSDSTDTPFTAGVPPTPLDKSLLFSDGRNRPDNICYSPAFPEIPQDLFNCYHKDRGKLQQLLEDYEGPEISIDLANDIQVVDAIDRLGHNFGILGPRDHLVMQPGSVEGQPLSPLIMFVD